jgi:hypothetical protein
VFDTVTLKHIIPQPAEAYLREFGWSPRFNSFNGLCRAWILNEPSGTRAPRLTISRCPKLFWHLYVQVSISAWLYDSNVILPTESDIKLFLPKLSDYLRHHAGFTFEAETAKVTRIDFSQNFQLGETKVIPAILRLMRREIPKYRRVIYDDKTVEYRNQGQKKTKTIKFYSKLDEVIKRKRTNAEQEMAKGILRAEVSYTDNNATDRLRIRHGLEDKSADTLLNSTISEIEVGAAAAQVKLIESLPNKDSSLEKLLRVYPAKQAQRLTGFISLLDVYGQDFYKIESLNYGRRTYFNNLEECRIAEVFPL